MKQKFKEGDKVTFVGNENNYPYPFNPGSKKGIIKSIEWAEKYQTYVVIVDFIKGDSNVGVLIDDIR